MGERVMIVDDESETLILLKTFLEERGYEVKTFLNGKDALNEVKEFNPHLILLDWRMPGMNGMEVFGRLRLDKETEKIPVIFVSARTLMGDVEKALVAGVDDYICKPIELEELLRKVKKVLKR